MEEEYVEPFRFPSEPSLILDAFDVYVRSFESAFSRRCEVDLDRDPKEVKRDLFLSSVGEDFLRIAEEIFTDAESQPYDVLLVAFRARYRTPKSALKDLKDFRNLHQEECESLSEYVCRVRLKASLLNTYCSEDLEKNVLTQILLGLTDETLRTAALDNAWSVDELLSGSESLDRDVIVSLKGTDCLVTKLNNGSFYEKRALEVDDTSKPVGRKRARSNEEKIITPGELFSETNAFRKKVFCSQASTTVNGITVAAEKEDGDEDEEVQLRKKRVLNDILKELSGAPSPVRSIKEEFEKSEDVKSQKSDIPAFEVDGLKCGTCSQNFADKKLLHRHRQKTCKECDRCFQTKSEFSLHRVETHNNTSCQCHLCNKVFTSKTGLDIHVQTVHEKNESFKCAYCPRGFPIERILISHVRRVHIRERKFSCERCGKGFETNGMLTKHINGVHEKKVCAICHICSKSFTQESCYRAHVLRVHENVRNYECDVCLARFHANADLRKHKKGVHDKILDFICEHCNKGFSRNSILQKHIKAIHSHERDFQCTLCTNAYVSKYNLHRHIQEAHEHVKQKCDICQRDIAGFGAGNLAKHKRTAHGITG